jgi:hypothetical protein
VKPSYLWETPPWCPTPECFMEDGPDHRQHEHHVEACPMSETFAAAWHRLDHSIWDARAALRKGLEGYRPPFLDRLRIRWYRITGKWPL